MRDCVAIFCLGSEVPWYYWTAWPWVHSYSNPIALSSETQAKGSLCKKKGILFLVWCIRYFGTNIMETELNRRPIVKFPNIDCHENPSDGCRVVVVSFGYTNRQTGRHCGSNNSFLNSVNATINSYGRHSVCGCECNWNGSSCELIASSCEYVMNLPGSYRRLNILCNSWVSISFSKRAHFVDVSYEQQDLLMTGDKGQFAPELKISHQKVLSPIPFSLIWNTKKKSRPYNLYFNLTYQKARRSCKLQLNLKH
jgi:hypothetical protein